MMHDFNVTAQLAVFMDLPVVFDLDVFGRRDAFSFRRDNGARLVHEPQ